jgi:hypothetical protein
MNIKRAVRELLEFVGSAALKIAASLDTSNSGTEHGDQRHEPTQEELSQRFAELKRQAK